MRATSTRTSDRKPPTAWIIGGVVALIVVIAAIVAITSSGDDEETAPRRTHAGRGPTDRDAATDGGDTDTDVSLGPIARSGVPAGAVAAAAAETGAPSPSPGICCRLAPENAIRARWTAPTLSGQSFDGQFADDRAGEADARGVRRALVPALPARGARGSSSGARPATSRAGVDVVRRDGTRETGQLPAVGVARRGGWPYPVLLDDEESTAAIAMGIDAYPYFLLLDADGNGPAPRQRGDRHRRAHRDDRDALAG
jgi:hypothetical protein